MFLIKVIYKVRVNIICQLCIKVIYVDWWVHASTDFVLHSLLLFNGIMETWQWNLVKWIGVLYLNGFIWITQEFLNTLLTCLTRCDISNKLMLLFEQPYIPYIPYIICWESSYMISCVFVSTHIWNHLYKIPFTYEFD